MGLFGERFRPSQAQVGATAETAVNDGVTMTDEARDFYIHLEAIVAQKMEGFKGSNIPRKQVAHLIRNCVLSDMSQYRQDVYDKAYGTPLAEVGIHND